MERPNPTEVLADFTDEQIGTLLQLFEDIRTYNHVKSIEIASAFIEEVRKPVAEGERDRAVSELQSSLGRNTPDSYTVGGRYQGALAEARQAKATAEVFESIQRQRQQAQRNGWAAANPVTLGKPEVITTKVWTGHYEYPKDRLGRPDYSADQTLTTSLVEAHREAIAVFVAGKHVGYIAKPGRSTKWEFALVSDLDGHGEATTDRDAFSNRERVDGPHARGWRYRTYGQGTGKQAGAEALAALIRKHELGS